MVKNEDVFPYFGYAFDPSKYLPVIEVIPNAFYINVAGKKDGPTHINIAIYDGSQSGNDPGTVWKSIHPRVQGISNKETLENIITACQYIIQEYYAE